MTDLDNRFALLRNGALWYAARISGKSSPAAPTFLLSGNGTRDARGAATQTTDIEVVARAVLREGRRARFAPESGPASSLYVQSRDVIGWRLDPAIAATIGVVPTGAVP